MCAWVPPGMCLKMIGRSTLRKHHDFDETFSFGKNEAVAAASSEVNALNSVPKLEQIWQEESRTTVSQSQNKDIEKFWNEAKQDKDVLKKTLNMDEAAANRHLFASAKSKNALRFEDEERPQLSHYKTNFSTSVLAPKATLGRPKSALDYGTSVQQAKQNKFLGKQSSVCLTYY